MTTSRPVEIDATTDIGWKTLTAVRDNTILHGKAFIVEIKIGSITTKQFGALHVWCDMVAQVLNDAGLDQRIVLKPEVSIDWTKDSVKNNLYKPLLKAMTGKKSTTEQDRVESSAVVNTMARHLGEKFGVTLPEWPAR